MLLHEKRTKDPLLDDQPTIDKTLGTNVFQQSSKKYVWTFLKDLVASYFLVFSIMSTIVHAASDREDPHHVLLRACQGGAVLFISLGYYLGMMANEAVCREFLFFELLQESVVISFKQANLSNFANYFIALSGVSAAITAYAFSHRTSPAVAILAQTLGVLKFVGNIKTGYVQRHLDLALLIGRRDLAVVEERYVKHGCIGAMMGLRARNGAHIRATHGKWCMKCCCQAYRPDNLRGVDIDDPIYGAQSIGELVPAIKDAEAARAHYSSLQFYREAGKGVRFVARGLYATALMHELATHADHTPNYIDAVGGKGGGWSGAALGAGGDRVGSGENSRPSLSPEQQCERSARVLAFRSTVLRAKWAAFVIPNLMVQIYLLAGPTGDTIRSFFEHPANYV